MNRRDAPTAIASCAFRPAISLAKESKRVPVIGMLITHPPVTDPVVEAMPNGLRQHGYEDGENIKLEVRSALGQLERVPALAHEIVQLNPNVIVLFNDPALRAVLQATKTIPIEMTGCTDDPTAMESIKSYRRPGGIVTGTFTVNSALIAKRLELIKEMLPMASRVAVFWGRSFGQRQLEEAQRVSPQLGLQLQPIEIRRAADITPAFTQAKQAKVDALLLVWTPGFYVHRNRIATLVLEAKLLLFSDQNLYTEAGGITLLRFARFSQRRARHTLRQSYIEGRKASGLAGRTHGKHQAGGEHQDR